VSTIRGEGPPSPRALLAAAAHHRRPQQHPPQIAGRWTDRTRSRHRGCAQPCRPAHGGGKAKANEAGVAAIAAIAAIAVAL